MNTLQSDSLKEHFITGLILYNGWKFDRYPSYKKYSRGEIINSRSQIIVKKGDFQIRMNQLDGRLGGGFTLKFDKNTPKNYNSVYMFYKKYDEVINTMHSLMRMV